MLADFTPARRPKGTRDFGGNVNGLIASAVSTEFMRAKLARRLYGTPILEALLRAKFSRWSTRHEHILALHIELGDVAPEPGSEPAGPRLRRIAHARGIAEEAVQQDRPRCGL